MFREGEDSSQQRQDYAAPLFGSFHLANTWQCNDFGRSNDWSSVVGFTLLLVSEHDHDRSDPVSCENVQWLEAFVTGPIQHHILRWSCHHRGDVESVPGQHHAMQGIAVLLHEGG